MAAKTMPKDHEARCRGRYELPGVTIQVEKTITLIPEQDRFCPAGFLFNLRDGRLIAGNVPSEDGAMRHGKSGVDAGQIPGFWVEGLLVSRQRISAVLTELTSGSDLLSGSEERWLGKLVIIELKRVRHGPRMPFDWQCDQIRQLSPPRHRVTRSSGMLAAATPRCRESRRCGFRLLRFIHQCGRFRCAEQRPTHYPGQPPVRSRKVTSAAHLARTRRLRRDDSDRTCVRT